MSLRVTAGKASLENIAKSRSICARTSKLDLNLFSCQLQLEESS